MGHRWPPMQVGMWIQWKAMNWNRAVSSVSSFSIPSLSINQSYQNLTWGILRLVLPPWIVSKDHESKTMIVALEHKLHRSLGLSPGVPINPCWDACQRKWLWTKLVYYRKYWRSCNLWYSEFQMYASQRFYETSGLDSGTWGWTGSSFFLMNSQNGTSWQPGVFTRVPTASAHVNDCSKGLDWYSWKHKIELSKCRSSAWQSFLSSSPNCMAFDSGNVQWLCHLVCKFQRESLWNQMCVCTLPPCDNRLSAKSQVVQLVVLAAACLSKRNHHTINCMINRLIQNDFRCNPKGLEMKPNRSLQWKELLAQLCSQFLCTELQF